ncbi:MAG: hypothetical protein HY260_06495 [Chloroflexi bacterium]|nr:hypothetical protein [Chloroflexota bacterium]
MTDQLLKDFEPHIASLKLIPSDDGVFEVSVSGDLVFSKKQLGRHAEYDEIRRAVETKLNGKG